MFMVIYGCQMEVGSLPVRTPYSTFYIILHVCQRRSSWGHIMRSHAGWCPPVPNHITQFVISTINIHKLQNWGPILWDLLGFLWGFCRFPGVPRYDNPRKTSRLPLHGVDDARADSPRLLRVIATHDPAATKQKCLCWFIKSMNTIVIGIINHSQLLKLCAPTWLSRGHQIVGILYVSQIQYVTMENWEFSWD